MLSAAVKAKGAALGALNGAAVCRPAQRPAMNTMADRIRRYRNRRGLSQAELAALLGVKPPSVAQWELGISKPKMERLGLLSEILGVSVAALVRGEMDPADARRAELVQMLPQLADDHLDILLRMAHQLAKSP